MYDFANDPFSPSMKNLILPMLKSKLKVLVCVPPPQQLGRSIAYPTLSTIDSVSHKETTMKFIRTVTLGKQPLFKPWIDYISYCGVIDHRLHHTQMWTHPNVCPLDEVSALYSIAKDQYRTKEKIQMLGLTSRDVYVVNHGKHGMEVTVKCSTLGGKRSTSSSESAIVRRAESKPTSTLELGYSKYRHRLKTLHSAMWMASL